MEQKWNFEVGDVVKLKKPHPCGSHEWGNPAGRSGFPAEMHGCGHQVMTERKMVEKNARGLTKAAEKRRAKCRKKLNEAWKRAENGRKIRKKTCKIREKVLAFIR